MGRQRQPGESAPRSGTGRQQDRPPRPSWTDRKRANVPPLVLWIDDHRWKLLAAIVIVFCTVAVYSNSFEGPFVFDDLSSVTVNPSIRKWSHVLTPPRNGETVSGRPILNLSLAINFALSGEDVFAYHATNLLIHILNALLLFTILTRTFQAPPLKQKFGSASTGLSLVIALLWALHPMQTESVTYVVQRAESLGAFFYLLTFYCVIRGAASPHKSVSWYVAAVIACFVGVGTKEIVGTAPVVILLYDRTFMAGSFPELLRRRRWLYLGLFSSWIVLISLITTTGLYVRKHEFEVPDSWPYARSEPNVILYYLRLVFWPYPLCLDYEWPINTPLSTVLPGILIIGSVVLATAYGVWRRKPWAFLGAWFFLILAPSSSIYPLKQLAFAHRMYLSLAAVLCAVVVCGYLLFKRLERSEILARDYVRNFRIALPVIAMIVLGVMTFLRNNTYHTALAIWEDTVYQSPHNPYARNNLGLAYAFAGRTDEAIAQFEEAVRLKHDHVGAYANLGLSRATQGRLDEAMKLYDKALEIKPDHVETRYNKGNALVTMGRLDEALECYNRSLELNPDFAEPHNNIGAIMARQGRVDDAIFHFQRAIEISPSNADAHNNLGVALGGKGRVEEAIAHYQAALKLKPDFKAAHDNLMQAMNYIAKVRGTAQP